MFHVSRVGAESTSFSLNAQFQADSTLFLYHRLDLRSDINCRHFYRLSSEGWYFLAGNSYFDHTAIGCMFIHVTHLGRGVLAFPPVAMSACCLGPVTFSHVAIVVIRKCIGLIRNLLFLFFSNYVRIVT